jgi:hypothetical protein
MSLVEEASAYFSKMTPLTCNYTSYLKSRKRDGIRVQAFEEAGEIEVKRNQKLSSK